jgi:predicted nucleic acid-binding protein
MQTWTSVASVQRVTRFVIDPSTLLHIVADGVDVHPSHQLVAPSGIRSTAMCLLLQAVQHGELSEELALRHHERLTALRMRLLNDRVSRRAAWKIAREQDWATTYHAEYLAIAMLQADALVAGDAELAAKADGMVPLADITALTDEHV